MASKKEKYLEGIRILKEDDHNSSWDEILWDEDIEGDYEKAYDKLIHELLNYESEYTEDIEFYNSVANKIM